MNRANTQSVFVKLFVVLVITGVLINIVVFWAFRFLGPPPNKVHHRISHTLGKFSQCVEKDILKDFSVEGARKVLEKTGIDVRAEGAADWATSPHVPHYSELKFYPIKHGFFQGKFNNSPFWVSERTLPEGKVRLIFLAQPGPPFENAAADIVVILLLLTLIVTLSFFTIRRVLNPINDMGKAVAELTEGNLDYKIPVSGKDELGVLAESFNTMIGRLQEMIRGREQLLLDVSHELRSPITRAKLATEFLPESETKLSIQSELREVETMIHELLESARLRTGHAALRLRLLDITALVQEMLAKLSVQGNLVLLGSPPSIELQGDEERLKTVLKNVIENAVKYSSTKTPVEVSVRELAGSVEITIQDYGVGIPPDEIEKVFEPFYRVDKSRTRSTGGYGLGLSLARNILSAHGGSIEITSQVGKGTRVLLSLPKT